MVEGNDMGPGEDGVNRLLIYMRMIRKKPFGMVDLFQIWNLLEAGCDPNEKDLYGIPPIIYASKKGNIMLIRLLLRYSANINKSTTILETALSTACSKSHRRCAKFLIKRGANVNVIDKSGYSPLRWAAKIGDQKLVKLLLHNGASIISECMAPNSAIDLAREGGFTNIQYQLLDLLVQKRSLQLDSMKDTISIKGNTKLEIKSPTISKTTNKKLKKLKVKKDNHAPQTLSTNNGLKELKVSNESHLKYSHIKREWVKSDTMTWSLHKKVDIDCLSIIQAKSIACKDYTDEFPEELSEINNGLIFQGKNWEKVFDTLQMRHPGSIPSNRHHTGFSSSFHDDF